MVTSPGSLALVVVTVNEDEDGYVKTCGSSEDAPFESVRVRFAFLMVSVSPISPFFESDAFRSFGKEFVNVALPQQLAEGANQIFTFASGKVEVGALSSDASWASVADAVDGAAHHVRLHTAGAIPVWLVVLLFCGALVVVLVALALILISVLPKPEKEQKENSKNEGEAKADEA